MVLPSIGFLAEPHRFGEFRKDWRPKRRLPPRLAPGPAGLEIAGEHVKKRQIPVRQGGVDAGTLQTVMDRESLVESVQLSKPDGLVVERLDEVRS